MSAQNLTLLTDLYELTMMQGYFETQENQTVVFDVFFRDNPNKGGYSVMAGLDQVIDYIKNLNFSYEDVDYLRGLGLFSEDFLHYLSGFHFSGDIYAIPEGSVIFPREPLLKVVAPIPCCLCGTRRRYHGVRTSPRPGTGCGTVRSKSCCDRWMRRNFQCTRRRNV